MDLFCEWIADLSEYPGVDHDRVGLFGFSAGAYAVPMPQPDANAVATESSCEPAVDAG